MCEWVGECDFSERERERVAGEGDLGGRTKSMASAREVALPAGERPVLGTHRAATYGNF